MIDISYDDLKALAHKGFKPEIVTALADHAEHVLADYGITTRLRVCHFWAQAANECRCIFINKSYCLFGIRFWNYEVIRSK